MTNTSAYEQLRTIQYADGSNLNARIEIHCRFSTGEQLWPLLFDQIAGPTTRRILELECGTGQFWLENIDRFPADWEITLSDFSEGMLREAEANLHSRNRSIAYRVIDAQSIPFDENSFDTVIANFMLYHVPDRPKALSEICRVLTPKGTLFAATIGQDHMQEMTDIGIKFGLPEVLGDWNQAFCLENGQAQLSRFFSEVTCLRLEAGLRITEADPAVDYLLSKQAGRPSNEVLCALRRHIEAIIESHGVFHVRKTTGLFVARQPKTH